MANVLNLSMQTVLHGIIQAPVGGMAKTMRSVLPGTDKAGAVQGWYKQRKLVDEFPLLGVDTVDGRHPKNMHTHPNCFFG